MKERILSHYKYFELKDLKSVDTDQLCGVDYALEISLKEKEPIRFQPEGRYRDRVSEIKEFLLYCVNNKL